MSKSAGNSPLKLFVLFVILVIAVVWLVSGYKKTNFIPQNPSILIKPVATPTVNPDREVHSPDGKMKIVMKISNQSDGSKLYSFYVSALSGENQKLLFSKTVENGSMTLPLNSFSPDDKYVFLREDDSNSFTFLVFKANGDSFSDGQNYLDVATLFIQKKVQYVFKDVTGWDDPTLLHVTTSTGNTKGPSFWFDIDSRSFIQLATR